MFICSKLYQQYSSEWGSNTMSVVNKLLPIQVIFKYRNIIWPARVSRFFHMILFLSEDTWSPKFSHLSTPNSSIIETGNKFKKFNNSHTDMLQRIMNEFWKTLECLKQNGGYFGKSDGCYFGGNRFLFSVNCLRKNKMQLHCIQVYKSKINVILQSS